MKLDSYEKVTSVEKAFNLLKENQNSILIAGGGWLKLSKKKYDLGIDLSGLELDQIVSDDHQVTIGSMVTLRAIEENKDIQEIANGILSKAAGSVMGVPLRNIATLGGSVCGKFGFSDLITPLVALEAQLNFYKKGLLSIGSFLESKDREPDILLSIIIKRGKKKGFYETIKKTSIDFPVINIGLVLDDNAIMCAIGARPGGAVLYKVPLTEIDHQDKNEIGDRIVDNIILGSNTRASKEYRKELCRVLINRGVSEVMA